MSKFNIAILCLVTAMLPASVLLAMNYDKIVVEDRQLGTLLYFTENS